VHIPTSSDQLFQTHPITNSNHNRSLIPISLDHLFQSHPIINLKVKLAN